MLKTFKNKALAELASKKTTRRIDARLHRRVLSRLFQLHAAATPEDMNAPGFDFHALKGFVPTRYSVHINGPWCITFEFRDGNAYAVDFEQYH